MRVIKDEDDNPWWVARDICRILGLNNTNFAVKNVDSDDKGITKVDTLKGKQSVITLNESGLYTLIIRSNKPEAKKFQRWITKDVLPSIRKTGQYKMDGSGNGKNSSGGQGGYLGGQGAKKDGRMYFPMAKLVESADKYLEGRAALKALNYFTGMPVDDLLEELDEKKNSFSFGGLKSTAQNLAQAGEIISRFMSDCCEFDETYEVGATILYDSFCSWCQKKKIELMKQKRFGVTVSKNFQKFKHSNVFYKGLRLKQER